MITKKSPHAPEIKQAIRVTVLTDCGALSSAVQPQLVDLAAQLEQRQYNAHNALDMINLYPSPELSNEALKI